MLNGVLGNHSQILGLNELHYIGETWDPAVPPTNLTRAEAKPIIARLLAVAHRSAWKAETIDADFENADAVIARMTDGRLNSFTVYAETLAFLARSAERTCVVDQTPRNIYYVGKLLDYLPESRVIHMYRDPRAVMCSQKNRWRQRFLGAKHVPLRDAIRVFANYHPFTTTRLWTKAWDIGEALDGRSQYYRLKFESLVASPTEELKKLCRFLGVDFEPGMLNVPRFSSSNLGGGDRGRGISSDVVDVWRNQLTAGEIGVCEYMAADRLNRGGYEPVGAGVPVLSALKYALLFPLHVVGVLLTNPKVALRVQRAMRR